MSAPDSRAWGRAVLGIAACLVVVALLCALGRGAQASRSGSSPAVLFERGGDLYVVAIDGSGTARLTKTRAAELEPAVSPDESTIVFSLGGNGIWTMRLDGTHRKRLTDASDDGPAWSPDGSTIYFVRWAPVSYGGGASCGSIFRVASVGGDARRVTRPLSHSHVDPTVSPHGRRIAFADWNACEGGTSSVRLAVVDTEGRPTSDLARLPGNDYVIGPEYSGPEWSPDGRELAFSDDVHLCITHRDGTHKRCLFQTSSYSSFAAPAWSPNGRWIAVERNPASGPHSLYIIHPDASGLRRLARSSSYFNSLDWLSNVRG